MSSLGLEKFYSEQPDFNAEWTHISSEGVMVSPFAVAVIGIHKEALGVGAVLGALEETDDRADSMPVICMVDPFAPRKAIELLGLDCFWTPIKKSEVADTIARFRIDTIPSRYAQLLEQ
jgi:hypothetical protein